MPSWYFSQMKGSTDDECNEVDQISSMSFDSTGNFLATGDRGGRVVIFRRNELMKHNIAYDVYGTFTSHEAGFDYLKSVEIEEKINKIEWLPKINSSRCLLTTNDKVIKLWRVKERCSTGSGNSNEPHNGIGSKSSWRRQHRDQPYVFGTRVESSCRKTFGQAHTFNINSLSINSDQETFLSSDELRINVWNLQHTDQSFNIVDLKPPNMENLTEVITAAKFHPTSCSVFVYSLSKGIVRLCDMRQRALCDQYALQFVDSDESVSKSFFSEIISSISDIAFSHSGHMLQARDYLNLKVWDMRRVAEPIHTFPIHDHFRAKLCGLYENDCIFDKFECSWSADDQFLLTGSYNNFFRVFDTVQGNSVTLQVSKDMIDGTIPLANKFVSTRSLSSNRARENEVALESLDFSKKILHLNWHPEENVLAIAATNNLFVLQNHSYVVIGDIDNDDGGGGGGVGEGSHNISSDLLSTSSLNQHQLEEQRHYGNDTDFGSGAQGDNGSLIGLGGNDGGSVCRRAGDFRNDGSGIDDGSDHLFLQASSSTSFSSSCSSTYFTRQELQNQQQQRSDMIASSNHLIINNGYPENASNPVTAASNVVANSNISTTNNNVVRMEIDEV